MRRWEDFFRGLLRWSSRLHLATIHSAVSFVCPSLWLRLFDSAERPPTLRGNLPRWRGLESQCVRNNTSIRAKVNIPVFRFAVTSLWSPNITLNRFMFWLLAINTWQLSSRMLSFCFSVSMFWKKFCFFWQTLKVRDSVFVWQDKIWIF